MTEVKGWDNLNTTVQKFFFVFVFFFRKKSRLCSQRLYLFTSPHLEGKG